MSVAVMRALLESNQRVQALAEVVHRFAPIVVNLMHTVTDELPAIGDAAVRDRLERALIDVEGQVAAMQEALDRALEDLPEGK